MRIKLSDADRERYGVPEWMSFDLRRPKLSEIRAVREVGFKGWADLDKHLNGDDIDDRLAARAAVYWLAIRRHTAVEWDEFDLDLLAVVTEGDEPDPNASAPTGA